MTEAFSSQTQSQSFTKSLRLLNSSDFKSVFDDAPLRASHQMFLFLARLNCRNNPRLGLVIAKKHIRNAVERNRVKRLIRETFRVKQQQLPYIDVIVLSRKGMNDLTNAELLEQLNIQWQRLIRRAKKDTVDLHSANSILGHQQCSG